MYNSSGTRNDGLGAQYHTLIYSILYTESIGNTYVYMPIKNMDHNYDNKDDYIDRVEDLMNIKNNYLNIGDKSLENIEVVNLNYHQTEAIVEKDIDKYLNSESMKKLKDIFWKNKDRNHFKNNKLNIAVHVRRPNSHDTRIMGTDIPNHYYLNLMNLIRNKYGNLILFHIYSQGDIAQFECYKNDDVVLHLDEDLCSTFIGMVAADVMVTSFSSYSYAAALLSDGEIYYIPFWHPPSKNWMVVVIS